MEEPRKKFLTLKCSFCEKEFKKEYDCWQWARYREAVLSLPDKSAAHYCIRTELCDDCNYYWSRKEVELNCEMAKINSWSSKIKRVPILIRYKVKNFIWKLIY